MQNLRLQSQREIQELIQRSQYYEFHYFGLLQARQTQNIQPFPSQQMASLQQLLENPVSLSAPSNSSYQGTTLI